MPPGPPTSRPPETMIQHHTDYDTLSEKYWGEILERTVSSSSLQTLQQRTYSTTTDQQQKPSMAGNGQQVIEYMFFCFILSSFLSTSRFHFLCRPFSGSFFFWYSLQCRSLFINFIEVIFPALACFYFILSFRQKLIGLNNIVTIFPFSLSLFVGHSISNLI